MARPEDCAALHAMILEHATFERGTATLTEQDLQGLLGGAPRPVELFVAAALHELLGYAALTYDFSLWRARRSAHLDCLFVRAEWRGQAIGMAMFQYAVGLARAAGADQLEWQTPDWNAPAITFYKRQGAAISDKARFCLQLEG